MKIIKKKIADNTAHADGTTWSIDLSQSVELYIRDLEIKAADVWWYRDKCRYLEEQNKNLRDQIITLEQALLSK